MSNQSPGREKKNQEKAEIEDIMAKKFSEMAKESIIQKPSESSTE